MLLKIVVAFNPKQRVAIRSGLHWTRASDFQSDYHQTNAPCTWLKANGFSPRLNRAARGHVYPEC
jgi:hypothetical protein